MPISENCMKVNLNDYKSWIKPSIPIAFTFWNINCVGLSKSVIFKPKYSKISSPINNTLNINNQQYQIFHNKFLISLSMLSTTHAQGQHKISMTGMQILLY